MNSQLQKCARSGKSFPSEATQRAGVCRVRREENERGDGMASGAAVNWAGTGAAGRYLVASSDPVVRKRVLRAPEFAGRQGLEACGGAAVLAKLREVVCDGVMLDRNLADLDAGEVAVMIQREYPDVEVMWI